MKISVITVVFNNEESIERSLLSVISQKYKNIEYLVIDGGSTDGTLNILKKYKKHIDILISEKDKGIYDAMNKGVSLSTGDVVFFLNSDDEFYDKNVISAVVKEINNNPNADYYYGGVISKNIFGSNSENIFSQEISNQAIRWGENIRHQSLFVKRNLFDEIGYFDTSLYINADYEWQCRLVQGGYQGHYMNLIISFYDQNGRSSKSPWGQYLEKYGVIKKHFGNFYGFCFYFSSALRFSLIELFKKIGVLPFISKTLNIIRGTKYKK